MENKKNVQQLLAISYIQLFFYFDKNRESLFDSAHFEVEMSPSIQLQASYTIDYEKDKEGLSLWEVQLLYKKHFPIAWFSAEVKEGSPSISDYYYAFEDDKESAYTFLTLFLQKMKLKAYKVKPTKRTVPDLEEGASYYLKKVEEALMKISEEKMSLNIRK